MITRNVQQPYASKIWSFDLKASDIQYDLSYNLSFFHESDIASKRKIIIPKQMYSVYLIVFR